MRSWPWFGILLMGVLLGSGSLAYGAPVMTINTPAEHGVWVDTPNLNTTKHLFVPVGSDVNFTASVVNANGTTTFMLQFGDGYAVLACTDTLITRHKYANVSDYLMELHMFDEDECLSLYITVTTLNPLVEDMFSHNVTELFYGSPSYVGIIFESSFMHVECNVSFDDELAYTMERGTRQSMTGFIYTPPVYSTSGPTELNMIIDCSNYITEVSIEEVIPIGQPLSDVKLVPHDYVPLYGPDKNILAVEIGSNTTFRFTHVGGTLGEYTVAITQPFNYTRTFSNGIKEFLISIPMNSEGIFNPSGTVTTPTGTKDLGVYWNESIFLDPGIHVYDFCWTCFRMTAASTTVIEGTSQSSVHIFVNLSLPGANGLIAPEGVWCDWIVTDMATIHNPSFADRTDMLTADFFHEEIIPTYSSTVLEKDVNVTCNTPLGSQLMQGMFYHIMALTGVTVNPNNILSTFIAVGDQIEFLVTLPGAQRFVKVILDTGGNNIIERLVDFPNGNITMTHIYTDAGEHNVIVRAQQLLDDGQLELEFNDSMTVTALNPVNNLKLTVNGNQYSNGDTIVLRLPGQATSRFSLRFGGNDNPPSQVTCTAVLVPGHPQTIVVGDMSNTTVIEFEEAYTLPARIVQGIINCSNVLSDQQIVVSISIEEEIDGLEVEVKDGMYLKHLFEPILFSVSLGQVPTDGQLMVMYGDGLADVICLDTSLEFEMNYNYSVPGDYVVTATAWDASGISTGQVQNAVIVQNAIESSMSFTGTPEVYYPSNMTDRIQIIIADPLALPPSTVTCNITLEQIKTSILVSNYTDWFVANATEYPFEVDVTYGLTQSIEIFCWNLVSNISVDLEVQVRMGIQNLTIAVSNVSSQDSFQTEADEELFVACPETGSHCYIPNNFVNFDVSAVDGNFPIVYDIEYGRNGTQSHIDVNVTQLNEGYRMHLDMSGFGDNDGVLVQIKVIATEQVPTSPNPYDMISEDIIHVNITRSVLSHMQSFTIDGPSSAILPMNTPIQLKFQPMEEIIWDNVALNISCTWFYPNDSRGVDFDAKLNSSVDMLLYPVDGLLQTVKVRCENLVSLYTWKFDITVQRRLVDLAISLVSDYGVYTRRNSTFNITGLYGESELTYYVYGNSILVTNQTKPSHVDFEVTAILEPAGLFDIYVEVEDAEGNTTSDTIQVIVEIPLIELDMKSDSSGTVPPGLITFDLIGVGDAPDPTDVDCSWNFTGHPSFTITDVLDREHFTPVVDTVEILSRPTGVSKSVVTISVNVSVEGTVQISTVYQAHVSCANHVSKMTSEMYYKMQEKIEGVECLSDTEVTKPGETITITMTRDSGTNVTYGILIFGLGIPFIKLFDPIYTGDDLVPRSVTEVLPQEGHYTVVCTYHNDAEESDPSPTAEFEIQKEVKYLAIDAENAFTSNPDVNYPCNINEPVGLRIRTLMPAYGIPLTTYVDLEYGDANTFIEKMPAAAQSLGRYISEHQYSREHIGQVGVTLRAFNNVSELNLALTITLMEPPSECSITADKEFAVPNEVITFTVKCEHGSHVTVDMDFGDNTFQTDAFNYAHLLDSNALIHLTKTFVQSYNSSGNYTVSAVIKNLVSAELVTLNRTTILNVVPDLELHDDGPVLTPPGLVRLSLTTINGFTDSYTANDVSCLFMYGDEQSGPYYYFPDLHLPMERYTLFYNPSAETIQRTLDVEVTCSNKVSEKSTSKTVEIVKNKVVLKELLNNGPVVYGESLSWTLQIGNYGENTCFLWTFTNYTWSVLYGRVYCKSLPRFSSYNSYVYVSDEETSFTYGFNVNIGPVFELSILAENTISSDSITAHALVLAEPCDAPEVSVGEEGRTARKARQIYFSEASTIFGVISTRCFYEHYYVIQWTIFNYNKTVYMDKGSEVPLNFVSKADLNLLPWSLPVGKYVVELKTTMKGLPVDVISSDEMYLEVIQTPLVVSVVGGIERFISITESNIVFDAVTPSEDPDLDNIGDKSGMSWNWLCQTAVQSPIPYNYSWNENDGIDIGDCNFPPVKYDDSGVLTLRTKNSNINDEYVFTVLLRKPDGRSATYSQTIHIQAGLGLDIKIECEINCREYVNPDDNLRFVAECMNCNGAEKQTMWDYLKLDRGSNGSAYVPVTLPFTPYHIIDGSRIAIDFPPKTFTAGSTYRVKLQVTTSAAVGTATVQFQINSAPTNGSCEAKSVKGGDDFNLKVTVVCQGWRDVEEEQLAESTRRKRSTNTNNAPNLKFEVTVLLSYLDIGNTLLSYGRSPESAQTYLPLGDPSDNYTVPLDISVVDTFGTSTSANISFTNDIMDGLSDATLFNLLKELKKMTDAGDIQATIAIIWTSLSLQNVGALPYPLNVTSDMLAELYSEFLDDPTLFENITEIQTSSFYIEQISKLRFIFPNEIRQVSEILKYLAGLTSLLTPSEEDIASVIGTIAELPGPMQNLSRNYAVEERQNILTALLFSLGRFLAIASRRALMRIEEECTFQECTDGVEDRIARFNKPLVEIATTIIEAISDLSLLHAMPEETSVVIDTGDIIISSQRINRASLPGYSVRTRLGGIRFPEDQSVYEEITSPNLDITFWTFEQNPYVWDVGCYSINAATNQVKVRDSTTKEDQILLDTAYDDPFTSESVVVVENEPDPLYTQLNETSTGLAFHTFWMNDTRATAQLFFDFEVLTDVTLMIYVKLDGEPNVNDYDYKTVLPLGMPDPVPTDQVERQALLRAATGNSSIYSFVIPREVTHEIGLYTVAVFIIPYDDNGNLLTSANYTFYVQYAICQLWMAEEDTWTDDDCQVSGNTTFIIIIVISKVFPSSFGAGVFVAPNTISFGTVYEEALTKLKENIHVVLTVLFFIVLYIAIIPLAFRKDRVDRNNWTPLPVLGVPIPVGYHKYMIDVYTGFSTSSGTDSTVYITLVGKNSETEPIRLHTPDRKNFRNGALNRFLVGSKVDLGTICYIHMWHDSTGKGSKSDWYLEKVVISSITHNKKYLFLCENWLSLNKGDFKTQRILRLTSKYDLLQVKRMFTKRAKSLMLEDNLWISTFMRREVDYFTRVQRITAAVAIVFMVMISNAMWYGRGDSDTPKDGIQIGPLSFTLQSLMVSIYSVLTVLPVSLLIVIFFTKSKPRKEYGTMEETGGSVSQATQTTSPTPPPPYSVTDSGTSAECDMNTNNSNNTEQQEGWLTPQANSPKKKSTGTNFSGRFLPFWCAYVAWFLCIATIVVAAFFTISYSFEWGGAKSTQWLSSFLLCFLESEGLISPLKAIVLALLFAILCKRPTEKSDVYFDEEEDFYFRPDAHGDDKLLQEKLEKLRFRKWLENELQKAFRILIWHLLFMISLALVVFGNADSNAFKANENLKDLYYEPATEVGAQADFLDYLKDTVIPNMFLENQYNGKNADKAVNQFIANRYSKRLGSPGLRQFRVKKGICPEMTQIAMIDTYCIDDYSKTKEEKATFTENWILPATNVTYPPENPSQLQKAFLYDKGDATNYIYYGFYKDYYGRGYSVPFESDQARSEQLVDDLIESRWIDSRTRAVTVEFNVYNANINLFTLVSLLFEFPSVGSVLVRPEIQSVKLYRYIGGYGVFALIAEIIVFVFVVVLGVRIIVNVVKDGKKYFKSIFNWSEVLKVVFGAMAIVTYITRTLLIQSTVTRLLNNRDEHANFRGVILVDGMFLNFIGFTLYLQILQLLWVFKFNKSLALLNGTLKYTFEDLLGFLLAFCGIFIGFSILYYDTYGTLLWDYRTFLHTFYSNMSSILGHFRTAEYEEVAGLSGRLLFIGFMTSSVFFYLNMLVAIIVEVYEEVRSGDLDIGNEHYVTDLVVEKIKLKDTETD